MALRIPQADLPNGNGPVAPSVRVRPVLDERNFGGGRGVNNALTAAGGMGDDLSKIVFQEEMRAQETQFNELSIEAEKEEQARRTALSQIQGKDALKGADDALAQFDKSSGDILKKATSDRVRERLKLRLERNRMGLQAFAEPYARGQIEKYEAQAFSSSLDSIENSAVQGYADPLLVALKLDEQHQAIERFGVMTKKPPGWIKAESEQRASRIHQGVINQFLASRNDIDAKRYFEENKGGIIGLAHPGLKKDLEEGSYLGEARRTADALATLPTLSEARAKLKDMGLITEVRERADTMLIKEFGLREKAEERASDERFDEVLKTAQMFAKYGKTAQELAGPAWSKMSARQRDTLTDYVNEIAKGKGIQTRNNLFAALHGMTRDELASIPEAAFRGKFLVGLSKEDYNHAWGLYKAATEGGEKYASLKTNNDIIFDATRLANLVGPDDTMKSISDEKHGDTKKQGYYKKVFDATEELRLAHFNATKKNPDDKELRALASKAAMNLKQSVTFKKGPESADWLRADVIKRAIDITGNEVKTETFDLPKAWLENVYNLARSEPGLIPVGTPKNAFLEQNRERINLAYLASFNDASNERVMEILRGGQ